MKNLSILILHTKVINGSTYTIYKDTQPDLLLEEVIQSNKVWPYCKSLKKISGYMTYGAQLLSNAEAAL